MNKQPLKECVVAVAVPVPLRQTFDFQVNSDVVPSIAELKPGMRVQVPFGPRKLVGVITEVKTQSEVPSERLKAVIQVLDKEAVFDQNMWRCLDWLSRYYLAPIGEVVESALPVALRKVGELAPAGKKVWRLSDSGRNHALQDLGRAPLQRAIIERFIQRSELSAADLKQESSGWRQAVNSLLSKGWLEQRSCVPNPPVIAASSAKRVELNPQQLDCANALLKALKTRKFSCSLLHGVTGSGKTEVYFAAMREAIAAGSQVLLLVPEIGLTPQLIQRVTAQLACQIAVMHSGLSESERHLAWWQSRNGSAQVIVGTRSAIFSAFLNLGLIVVDEEHDGSFKQQDGVRYQARDVAVYRAKQLEIPIVLGSATPSLESFSHARSGRYQSLRLEKRATSAPLPEIHLLDLNRLPSIDGLSPVMLNAIQATLDDSKQAMLFLNRRGYAPVLFCASCEQAAKCHRCDSNLTLHKLSKCMRCHHCGYEGSASNRCSVCSTEGLLEIGEGTQRVENALAERFPAARVLRIDRDSTRRKGELAALLEQARSGEADILLGTQLLSKGHDFPNVSMVGILNSDQGLYSTDFHASESLFQQIVQVSGRAGRRAHTGQVFIQTRFPDHSFFSWVCSHDFDGFAADLLNQREDSSYPPFGYFALLRAESTHQAKGLQFLRRAKSDLQPHSGVRLMDAIAAPMERRAGRYRAQLLLCASKRSSLNATLVDWLNHLAADPSAKKLAASVRWSLDIDPLDHY